jgi:hypothetical protein
MMPYTHMLSPWVPNIQRILQSSEDEVHPASQTKTHVRTLIQYTLLRRLVENWSKVLRDRKRVGFKTGRPVSSLEPTGPARTPPLFR